MNEKITKVFDLSGKVALVTGGAHGIGMAIGKVLADAGAKLCINGTSHERLEKSKNEFAKTGIDVYTTAFDVSNEQEVNEAISRIEAEIGPVDILVNNAGIIKRAPILEMPLSDFKQVIDIDLIGPLIVSKRVVPEMINKRAGKIINICSLMSNYGRISVAAYASAKGGLKLLTQNMTCEWAKYNIQINGIAPGYIATSQTAPIREESHPFNDLVLARTPAGRWGEPEDIGNAALFLSSRASDFVNGHILYVDGGILANFGYVQGENVVADE
ncbi:gluconate 5-dehydrogenase [Draconibacterium sediminis]|uniref:Gluconate 5-dehydrogenase n=1 Tax=Draconibacterium sediminis TaxID=1544798 RepID=A0A0D8J5F7_9BACT|nr:gluconate 5-dehydrogenase [Draconibacterium sediminis]KJF41736.1 gluconate 5-dehydrogenase [Draconibacterium sediminis]